MFARLLQNRRYRILLALLFLSLAFTSGWWAKKITWHRAHPDGRTSACPVEPVRTGGYELINPLLLCDVAGKQEFPEYITLKKQLTSIIQTQEDAHQLTSVSIYFRDYTRGKWLNIGENETYAPASLLKVPLMIAYFKLAESHPEILSKKILYSGGKDYNLGQHYPAARSLEKGKYYTIEELIHAMIVYSDNNTLDLLNANIDNASLNEVYTDLGLSTPPIPTPDKINFLTVKAYAYFFRVLYNATYLTRGMSEKAFTLLLGSQFNGGITAGVPSNMKVAHKFGERTVFQVSPEEAKELHDCGIVYYPEHPYLLCVMTKGNDFENLSKTIQEISRTVYEKIESDAKASPQP